MYYVYTWHTIAKVKNRKCGVHTLVCEAAPPELSLTPAPNFRLFFTERGLGPLGFFLLLFLVVSVTPEAESRAEITDCSCSVGCNLLLHTYMYTEEPLIKDTLNTSL